MRARLLLASLLTWSCSASSPEVSAAPEPPPVQAAAPVVPIPPLYGFWGLNGFLSPEGLADVRDRFGITVFHHASTDPEWTVQTLLPMVREAGLRVTLRLSGSHSRYTNERGDFDLDAWKGMMARWDGAGLEPFIADGTLIGHMILDDIENFEGRDPGAAELEAMAAHSKDLLPGLMTFVRQRATSMPVPEGGRYVHVDAVVNQYLAKDGDVQAYAREQAARAGELGLGVIQGMNIADGGDGSSGRPGWRASHHPMTAEELRTYGRALVSTPECAIFLAWEYDGEELWSDGSIGAQYFDEAERQAALAELGALMAKHRPVPLTQAARAAEGEGRQGAPAP